jgi:hypothetical protein
MVGAMMMQLATEPADVEANCAICGAPPYPECPHEGQRLELAMNQAQQRWAGTQAIRYALTASGDELDIR